MKKLFKAGLLICICCLHLPKSYSQSLKEWIRQKKTQKQYLIQQIAAQQVYLNLLKEGASITRSGWGMIQGFKHGELDLHALFLGSLKRASPQVRQYGRILEIMAMQTELANRYRSVRSLFAIRDGISYQDPKFVEMVFAKGLKRAVELIEETIDLIGGESLELSDSQRIQRIDRIYVQMQDLILFSQVLLKDSYSLVKTKEKLQSDVRTGRWISGINDAKK